MKKTILFLLCSINLFAYKVESTNNKEAIIYPSKVVITESLNLEDDGDSDKIIYPGISKNIDINSINLIGGDIKEINLERKTDFNSTLEPYLGKVIQAKKNRKTYNLILLDYKKDIVGKDIKTGEIYILNNPDLKLNGNYMKTENNLIMDVKNLDKQLSLSYITQGLNVSLSHKLDIDMKKLETWGKIQNNTGKDLEDIKIKIISELSSPRLYMMKSEMADNITRNDSSDKIEYNLENTIDLKKSVERNVKLETKKINLVEKYVYETREYSKNPTRIVEIENISDTTIPMGRIYIWDDNKFVGDSNIGFIPSKEKYNLKLNKNFNVIIDKKIKNSYSLGKNLIHKDIEIKIKNKSNKKINLEVNYDQLPNIWTELKSKENFEKISNGKIKFRLDIDKNSNKIINFSYIEEKK